MRLKTQGGRLINYKSGLVLFSKDRVVIFKFTWNWQSAVLWSKKGSWNITVTEHRFWESSELSHPYPKLSGRGLHLLPLLAHPDFHCPYWWLPGWASCTQEAWLLLGSLALSSESQKWVRPGNSPWTECSCLNLYYVLSTRYCAPPPPPISLWKKIENQLCEWFIYTMMGATYWK